MVAGGVHGARGPCMVAGGVCGCGGVRGGWGGGACVGYDKILSMSGRYASYWNAFFFLWSFCLILFPLSLDVS